MPPAEARPAAAVFGASGAIGRAVTERLLASGHFGTVHAGSRSQFGLPQGARPFRFDLEDEESIVGAVAGFETPPAFVLVATGLLHDPARGIAPEKTLRAIDPAAMARVLAANTVGPALVAKHVLPRLERTSRNVFAVLSARVGSIGDNRLGGWHAYRASKAALNMLVRTLAIEMARTHPHTVVAALHPGTVDSDLSAPFQRPAGARRLFPPALAAQHLLTVIDRLTPAESGGHFAWDGTRLPD